MTDRDQMKLIENLPEGRGHSAPVAVRRRHANGTVLFSPTNLTEFVACDRPRRDLSAGFKPRHYPQAGVLTDPLALLIPSKAREG
jgi:hypothetical protein